MIENAALREKTVRCRVLRGGLVVLPRKMSGKKKLEIWYLDDHTMPKGKRGEWDSSKQFGRWNKLEENLCGGPIKY